jgi:nitrite reductase/ring-hydroxylating ferredoxin subunit/uncharacterized membrane protein
MDLSTVPDRIGSLEALDRVAKPLSDVANRVVTRERKHVLSGAWFGHPLHPLLTDLPIGAWSSAAMLDLVPGTAARRAARTLTGLGVVLAVPTAAAGWSDWSDLMGEDRRVGLVHAAANAVAIVLFARSFLSRVRGHHMKGRLFSLFGVAAMTAGGYLGGHLSYRRGVGVDHTAFDEGGTEWTDVGDAAPVDGGEPVPVTVDGVTVMVVRRGGRLFALTDRCSHLGGPLHEGTLTDTTVTCPWHGSEFRLDNGGVVCGPATAPQPVFEVRVRGGRLEVRRAHHAADDGTAFVAPTDGVTEAPLAIH